MQRRIYRTRLWLTTVVGIYNGNGFVEVFSIHFSGYYLISTSSRPGLCAIIESDTIRIYEKQL